MTLNKKRLFPFLFVLTLLVGLSLYFLNFAEKVTETHEKEGQGEQEIYEYIKNNPKNIETEERHLSL